ncbi:bifunctional adenosylcobinamide kinase/adenosylcobinamide-phosphate guanylyltransferase [Pelagibius marinus]|uniref:bifunctional adenosylcobinamide kinase/adenosylcobinamide-phosphate guanylyltransferase n=1 Tax=Pelagibius marinus TaxID=2762760 RepID=UPI00187243BB|nr:bifunctional adenosylcobinamide kinase/adenosylcobinamide-phosphate guanylyltransferase [Pelagibius marinus]
MTASSLPPVTLVLGGARSGKSSYAEELAESRAGACVYLATATAGDDEMAERIARHQDRRGARWRTVEAPLDLSGALAASASPDCVVLVDCLTLWLSNILLKELNVENECGKLVAALPDLNGPVIFVSNEVGLGIVPDNALARRFRDEAGRLNQVVAAAAQSVVFVAAGLPLALKPAP